MNDEKIEEASASLAARDAVIAQIESVFDGVSREGGVSLHEAIARDKGQGTGKRKWARRLDTETRWQDVPDSVIEANPCVLPFLNPVGFRYYMPAYMLWSLKNYANSELKTVDRTIYNLLPYRSLYRWKMQRFRFLTRPQAEAVHAFLRFMAEKTNGIADDYQARKALDGYWKRFCPTVS